MAISKFAAPQPSLRKYENVLRQSRQQRRRRSSTALAGSQPQLNLNRCKLADGWLQGHITWLIAIQLKAMPGGRKLRNCWGRPAASGDWSRQANPTSYQEPGN